MEPYYVYLRLLEEEDPFVLPGKKGKADASERPAPGRDDTLYDL